MPPMNKLIAILDDEADITELVALHLSGNGFTVKEFHDPRDFLKFLKKQIPALIILDLMLPGTSGLEICKFLKQEQRYASIPVIMLTAKAGETDKILGLELGADDYITKPFSPRELVARVKVALRRKEEPEFKNTGAGDDITIDRQRFEVMVEGKRVELTTTEFKILELLASKKGIVFSRDTILNTLWGEDKIVVDRTIDVHVRHLREKLKGAGKLIKNVRGMGYKLDA